MAQVEKMGFDQDDLLRSYVRAHQREGTANQAAPAPGQVVRQCSRCGMRSMFRLDPEGTWYECQHCKRYP